MPTPAIACQVFMTKVPRHTLMRSQSPRDGRPKDRAFLACVLQLALALFVLAAAPAYAQSATVHIVLYEDGLSQPPVVTVDGANISVSQFHVGPPHDASLTLNLVDGTSHTFCWRSPISTGLSDVRYALRHLSVINTTTTSGQSNSKICSTQTVGYRPGEVPEIDAQYVKQYAIDFAVSGNGTIRPSGTQWYANGSTISVSATPTAGSLFRTWLANYTVEHNQIGGRIISLGIKISEPDRPITSITIETPGIVTAEFTNTNGLAGGFFYESLITSLFLPLFNTINGFPTFFLLLVAIIITFAELQLPNLIRKRLTRTVLIFGLASIFFTFLLDGIFNVVTFVVCNYIDVRGPECLPDSGLQGLLDFYPLYIFGGWILVYFFVRRFWYDLLALLLGYFLTFSLWPNGLSLGSLVGFGWIALLATLACSLVLFGLATMVPRKNKERLSIAPFVGIGILLETVTLPLYLTLLVLFAPVSIALLATGRLRNRNERAYT